MTENKLSDGLKFKYSLYTAFLFYIFSSAQMYKLTNKLMPTSNNGCPSSVGLLAHTVIFTASVYGLMKLPKDK